MAPGTSIADVARAADVDVSLIYKWRRMFVVKVPERPRACPQFAEVAIKPEQPDAPVVDKAIVIEPPSAKLRIPPRASPELLKLILRELLETISHDSHHDCRAAARRKNTTEPSKSVGNTWAGASRCTRLRQYRAERSKPPACRSCAVGPMSARRDEWRRQLPFPVRHITIA